jgi:hypothetical protein
MNKKTEKILIDGAGKIAFNICQMAEKRVAEGTIFKKKTKRQPVLAPTNNVYKELLSTYRKLTKGQKQAIIYALENDKTIQNILRIKSVSGHVTFEIIK